MMAQDNVRNSYFSLLHQASLRGADSLDVPQIGHTLLFNK